MDFSKNYLLKYGWEEGQGLGKKKDGIKLAIKPKLKFDRAGMGYDPSIEFTNSWWLQVYNDALEDVNINTEQTDRTEGHVEENKKKVKSKKRKFKEDSFTDMFEACEGRTVHKGARQGLQLSGKLQRLEQQEQKLLVKKRKKNRKETDSNTEHSACSSVPLLPKEAAEKNKRSKNKIINK